MHKKYNKFLIVSFIGVFILGFYSYFYNDFVKEVYSADGSLTSSLGTDVVAPASDISLKAAEDTAFLMKLASLTKIKIDKSLFEDQSFKLLVDNNIKLDKAPYGRTNPFSPIENSFIVTTTETTPLKVNPTNLITNKSIKTN